MSKLSSIKDLKAHIKEILSNISQADGYNYNVGYVEDRLFNPDHIPATVSVAIGFQVLSSSFLNQLIDQGFGVSHTVQIMLLIRNADQNDIYMLADDVLRAFVKDQSTLYLSFQPETLDWEDIFTDEGHYAAGSFVLSFIQALPLTEYV